MSAAKGDFQDHIEGQERISLQGMYPRSGGENGIAARWGAEKSVHYIFDVA